MSQGTILGDTTTEGTDLNDLRWAWSDLCSSCVLHS